VLLSGFGSNCSVSGDNPVNVDVASGQDVEVSFQVTCVSPSLVFASNRDGAFNIFTVMVDGSSLKQLTHDAAPNFSTLPSWSPDGSKITFSSTRDRTSAGLDIWIMNADGSSVTRLTEAAGQNGRAAWSPDGSKIAFTSTRDAGGANDKAEIWVMNADGSGQQAITSDGAFANTPSWSPDGSKIVFQSTRDATNPATVNQSDFEIYVMDADGSNVTRLTNNSAFDGRASWLSSGAQITFDSRRDGDEEVYVMNADGSSQANVTNDGAEDGFAHFRP
jgi:Tol biopolymer transport system component